MERIEAVGFDLFNTLITVEHQALEHAVERLVHSLLQSGIQVDANRFVEDHRSAARAFLEQTRIDGRETHNRFWIQQALERQGFQLDPEDERIASAVEAYFSAFQDYVSLIPGTLDMLERLRSTFRLGLLSNFTHPPAAHAILRATGLDSFFDVLAISGDIGYRKPHPTAFEELVRGLGIESSRILYIGDDPEPDVTGALQSGLRPVWSTYVRDHGLAFAPGYARQDGDRPGDDVPRISAWHDLIALLEDEYNTVLPAESP